jgi:hypothetical protein
MGRNVRRSGLKQKGRAWNEVGERGLGQIISYLFDKVRILAFIQRKTTADFKEGCGINSIEFFFFKFIYLLEVLGFGLGVSCLLGGCFIS